jgi:hypothetical protein
MSSTRRFSGDRVADAATAGGPVPFSRVVFGRRLRLGLTQEELAGTVGPQRAQRP